MTIYRILGRKGRITIPYPLRQKIGFRCGDVISFAENGNDIILRKEPVCSHCKTEKREDMLDYFNRLTPEEQRGALIHLSLRWAEETSRKEERQ
jgi:AbrB family looped-hinge helix DNA binding protein